MKVTHGGDLFRISHERGWDWHDVLDFSANINPLGPAPGVRAAICAALDRVPHYPDPHGDAVRELLSEQWHVPASRILVGNGATELLHFYARICRPDRVTLVVPTFSEFHRAFPGAALVRWDELERWPTSGLLAITNPNNPSGRLARSDFENWLLDTSHPVMVDESFLDFTGAASVLRLVRARPRLFVLRSLTKFYAIPGLRIGALVGCEQEMVALRQAREPWQVNVLAESAAIASLQDKGYAHDTRRFVESERTWLTIQLAEFHGVTVEPSAVNFLYARLDYDPDRLCAFLLERKILLRNCKHWIGFAQPAVRLAVRTREENTRLLDAWKDFSCAC